MRKRERIVGKRKKTLKKRSKGDKEEMRKIHVPRSTVFYRAISILKTLFPGDDFTVLNPEVFETIIEHLKWELRLHGFTGSAASLFYDIIMDHPLVDGNKRLAVLMLNAYLSRNRYSLREFEDLYELAIKVAEGKIDKRGVLEWLRGRIVERK